MIADPGLITTLEAFARMRLANTRMLEALSREIGVSPTEIRALVFIQAQEGTTPKRVAEHLSLSPGALTSLLDRMERGSLVERRPHPTDRRSLHLHVTDAGRKVLARGGELYFPAFAAAVPPGEIADAIRIFDAVARELTAQTVALEPGRVILAG